MKSPRQFAAALVRRLLSPFLPARMQLPFSYFLRRLSGECGPDLTQVEKFFASTGIAIDVGANEGLFTYRFSRHFQHVYAFEINPELATPITRYNPGNITLYPYGLSSRAGTAQLRIPVANGLASTGWGTLESKVLLDAERTIQKDVQVKRLDEFGISNVDFIKIDVEGHELEVLKGGTATIETSRPVMLIEVADENLPRVNSWMEVRDFKQVSIEHIFHLKERNSNYIFAPAEKLNQLFLRA